MSEIDGMKRHGIYNSKADFWVHLFPVSGHAYYYNRLEMLEWIKENNPKEVPGKSKDGTVSASGILVPRILASVVSYHIYNVHDYPYDFDYMSDRETGFAGERIVTSLINRGKITFPHFRATAMSSKEEQFSAMDVLVERIDKLSIEIKTERNEMSGNLFIQTHEGGHRPTLVRENGHVFERHTPMQGF